MTQKLREENLWESRRHTPNRGVESVGRGENRRSALQEPAVRWAQA